MKPSTSHYRATILWSEDDWEYMNDNSEVGSNFVAYPAWVDEQIKVRKPVATSVRKPSSAVEHKEVSKPKDEIKYDTERDTEWFWVHLAKRLLGVNITLDQIDADQYYASNTDGQVCRVVRDTDDTKHPAAAACTTARKIVMFFAQQKLTEVNDEE